MEKRSEMLSYLFLAVVFVFLFFFLANISQKITGYAAQDEGTTSGECTGTANSCTSEAYSGDSQACESQEGCTYNPVVFVCEGTAVACNTYNTNTSCLGQDGCVWTSFICGDAIINGNEACDDGNAVSGDGCSSTCTVETGWQCSGEPSVCIEPTDCEGTAVACSSFVSESECISQLGCTWQGGTVTGALVTGFAPAATCFGTVTECSVIDSKAACKAQVDCNWTGSVSPSVVCGDNTIGTGEACDGTALGGATCASQGFDSGTLACASDCSYNISACLGSGAVCGDGQIGVGEACDDGNTTSGDGCSASCQVEINYTCSGIPSICDFNQTDLNNTNNNTQNNASPGNNNNTLPGDTGPYVPQSGLCKPNECKLGSKCYPVGYRTRKQQYCGADNLWAGQKSAGSCLNSFECKSYLCDSGSCAERSFTKRAALRLNCIFTDASCKGTGGFFVRLVGNEKAM